MADKKQIIDALGEVREHLILNKFNEAMMLMAQISIDVIEHLIDEALIVSKGYEEDLHTLKTLKVLSDDTAHNFETLIVSGVQAHNGVDIPKDHAEKALEVLSNELDILFKADQTTPDMAENIGERAKFNAKNEGKALFEYSESEDEPYKGDFSRDMTTEGATPAFMVNSEDENDFRKKERMREEMLASERVVKRHSLKKLVVIIIPIIFVLLIVFVVKAMFFSGSKKAPVIETTMPITEATFETETTETETTMPPEAGWYDITGDLVKIRDAATTEGSKVKGTVSKGDKLKVVEFYNADWAVVIFEGKEAFISRRYIRKDENAEPVTEVSGELPTEIAPSEGE